MEFHPLPHSLGDVPEEGQEDELLLRHDHLGGRGAIRRRVRHTYTDGPPLEGATDSHEWAHGLGETVGALVRAGPTIARPTESDEVPWPRRPRMLRTASGVSGRRLRTGGGSGLTDSQRGPADPRNIP
ncbi:hypothetical protein [Streptomyces macrosporus]|uniref:Uncharacterized protein n=1 Tax=Streptomyces macrosporus TaxID=44032 RepID=A0ABN3KEH0_9ACTN